MPLTSLEADLYGQARASIDDNAPAEAERILGQLIGQIHARLGGDALELAKPLYLLARSMMKQRPWDAAPSDAERSALERALQLELVWNGEESTCAMRIRETLAVILQAGGDSLSALHYMEAVVAFKERALEPGLALAHALNGLADILLAMGLFERCLVVYERSGRMTKECGDEMMDFQIAFGEARCLLGLGRPVASLERVELASAIFERRFGHARIPAELRALLEDARSQAGKAQG